MKKIIIFLGICIISFSLVGCGSFGRKMKAWLGGKPAPTAQKASAKSRSRASFSDQSSYMPGSRRIYKRTTKKKLESAARLDSKAGSLWVMEGQGAYLFSENIMRMIGDPIDIQIEGDPRKQLESKANVIKRLIERITRRSIRQPAREVKAKKAKKSKKKTATKSKKDEEELGDFDIRKVPTRIVERLVDGNYRIKGNQSFMIGRREYKVIVTGIVRSEDFSNDGISATRLLDSKFDIVSVRKGRRTL